MGFEQVNSESWTEFHRKYQSGTSAGRILKLEVTALRGRVSPGGGKNNSKASRRTVKGNNPMLAQRNISFPAISE